MLSFDEFSRTLENNIASRSDDIEVTIGVAEKNNGVQKPYICIKGKDMNVGINIHLEDSYEAYTSGVDINKICDRIYEQFCNNDKIRDYAAIPFEDYNYVKDHVVLRVVNSERNFNMLLTAPFKQLDGFDDLVAVGRVEIESNNEGNSSALVTEHLLDMIGMSAKEMFEYAKNNTDKQHPVVIEPMFKMLAEMTGMPEVMFEDGPPMYVVTNSQFMYGAGTLAYDGVFDRIKDVVKEDFYIIPSSVNELIVLPKSFVNECGEAFVNDMVREVNGTVVSPEEILSDNIYRYDSETRSVSTINVETEASKSKLFEDEEMIDMNEEYEAY